jgi:hypothetical protein
MKEINEDEDIEDRVGDESGDAEDRALSCESRFHVPEVPEREEGTDGGPYDDEDH